MRVALRLVETDGLDGRRMRVERLVKEMRKGVMARDSRSRWRKGKMGEMTEYAVMMNPVVLLLWRAMTATIGTVL